MNHDITVVQDHDVIVVRTQKMDSDQFWRWQCTCGKTTTGLFGFRGQAERAGLTHKTAKETTPR